MEKVVFFHMNQLGDLLFSLPILKAARQSWIENKLYSVIRPSLKNLLEATGLLDNVIAKNNGVIQNTKLISYLKSQNFAKAVLFSESPETLMLSYFSGIPQRFGFKTALLNFLLTDKAERTGVPSLKNNCNLAQQIGLNNVNCDYTGLIKIPIAHLDKIADWISHEKIVPENMIVIAPGSSRRRQEKRWNKDNWIKLLLIMVSNGLMPVLTGSTQEYFDLQEIYQSLSGKIKLFKPCDGLLSVGALFSKAKLFVGVDSGAMHLAASLNVPCVALFGPTDPAQIGPIPQEKHRIIQRASMSQITVDDVWKQICV